MNSSGRPQFAGQWKILLLCPSAGMGGALSELLGSCFPLAPVFAVGVYPPKQGLAEILTSQAPNLCFLDIASDRERAFNLITEIQRADPQLPIVALLSSNDPDLILRCLRQGAAEFLLAPFAIEHLGPVIDRIARLHPGPHNGRAQAKVLCVMPAKGACGASTIACNLAYQLKRLGAKRVLLADLDPLTGTLSFLLKLKSNYSFMDAVSRFSTLDEDLWKAIVLHTQGIDVLLSPESAVDGIHDLTDATPIVEFARQSYEMVVLDASGVYGPWSLSLARLCDELLLVTSNELPSLQATQRVLMYLDQNRVDRNKIRLLVNRYSRDVGLNKEVIETALHSDIYQLLPSDYDSVQKALIDGKPIPNTSSFGKGLSALAERLTGFTEPPPKKSSSWSGLLGLFSKTTD